MLKSLEEEAEALYKKSGKNPVINADLNALDTLKSRVKSETLVSSEWTRHDEALRLAALAKRSWTPRSPAELASGTG